MPRISLTLSLFLPFAITGSVVAQKMYWTGYDGVWRADLDGSNVELVVPPEDGREPTAISIDSQFGKMYWCERRVSDSDGWILRANLDGLSKETLTPAGFHPYGIALDVVTTGGMYWTSFPPFRIERACLDGSNREIVVSDAISDVFGLALDVQQQKMYWMDYSTGDAYRSNLDGTVTEMIMDGASYWPRYPELDLTNGKMYWSAGDLQSAGVFCANLDGSDPEQIVSTVGAVQDIALDPAGAQIYWLLYHFPESYNARLYRADLSGGNEELLVHIEYQLRARGLALYLPGSIDAGEASDDGNSQTGERGNVTCQIEPEGIPAISEWGLIVMALVLLNGITIRSRSLAS